MIKTYNFKIEPYDYSVPDGCVGEFRDYRNGFICVNPTPDLECYINYIELLNLHRDKWKSVGYLDLGMMPIAMLPSFLPNSIKEALVNIMNTYNIPCYNMPPVSVMNSVCKLPEDDIWVFKSDVSAVTGIPENQLTLERFLRWCKV